jgi:flagellar export protein FliJ
MKRFQFRLSRLEKLRDSQRREARSKLMAVFARAQERMEKREALEQAVRDADQVHLPKEVASSPQAHRELAAWREALRRALADAARKEIEAIRAVQEAEDVYTEASRSHRVLEKLRKRKRQRWIEEMLREEQKFLDETHLLRLARGQAGEEVPK